MKIITALLSLLMVGCFSDVVSNSYATVDEARAAHVFERGWLPDNLPLSATNIKISNNLDANTSMGEFTIDIKKSKKFIDQMMFVKNKNSSLYVSTYTTAEYPWKFTINLNSGHVKYVYNWENR